MTASAHQHGASQHATSSSPIRAPFVTLSENRFDRLWACWRSSVAGRARVTTALAGQRYSQRLVAMEASPATLRASVPVARCANVQTRCRVVTDMEFDGGLRSSSGDYHTKRWDQLQAAVESLPAVVDVET